MILPTRKQLYFIEVSTRILFTCMCIDKPPKEINSNIYNALCKLLFIKTVEKTPLVKSNTPFKRINELLSNKTYLVIINAIK